MGAQLAFAGPSPAPAGDCRARPALAGCGGAATSSTTSRTTVGASKTVTPVAQTSQRPKPPPRPSYPRLLRAALGSSPTAFVPAVSWRGRTAVWIARSPSGVALLSFDQHLVEVRLHSGTVDAGGSGWRFGPAVVGGERRRLVAAFNGGFRFSTGAGGFESYGRVGAPVGNGLASIVTYVERANRHRPVARRGSGAGRRGGLGAPEPDPADRPRSGGVHVGCISCWGATLGGVVDPARSALGITADGRSRVGGR